MRYQIKAFIMLYLMVSMKCKIYNISKFCNIPNIYQLFE